MVPRLLSKKLIQASKKFPVVAVTGPRQSGKTTLVKEVFPSKDYVSFEDPDIREFASTDPRGFLANYQKGAIFDEVQRAPQTFSYLQGIVDKSQKPGMFILTGSQHFLLLENLSQTLAGRVQLLKLLPFSLAEIRSTKFMPKTVEETMFKGMYPRIYQKGIHPRDWYPSYVETYIERDVRQIKNVADLATFRKFVKMCAARIGQLLDLTSLGNDCGVTHNTAKAWIGILEASYLLFLLQPHHQNFNKRLVKMPKLYFYDTGLACSLLGIEDEKQLIVHPLRGNLFESFIISELMKTRYNAGLPLNLYFWRDKTGHEIDCLWEKPEFLVPIEIKSSETITSDYFKNLAYWKKIAQQKDTRAFLFYAGNVNQEREGTSILGWKEATKLTL